jgi:uncharacterized membrane protein YccC
LIGTLIGSLIGWIAVRSCPSSSGILIGVLICGSLVVRALHLDVRRGLGILIRHLIVLILSDHGDWDRYYQT